MDREDHHLKYIMLPATPKPTDPDATEPSFEIKRFNLNPNGDDHVSFSILYAPSPPLPTTSFFFPDPSRRLTDLFLASQSPGSPPWR